MIGYRNSSHTGDDAFTNSRSPAVPVGSVQHDVVVVFLSRWQNATATVSMPTGFTRLPFQALSGDGVARIDAFWKRLTGTDTGSYTFSWAGSSWCSAEAMSLFGVLRSGDPVNGRWSTWAGTAGTFGATSLVTDTIIPGLVWNCYNDSTGTHAPPTGFTETVDVANGSMAYMLPAAAGTHTASGATVTSSSSSGVVLLALEPEPDAVVGPEPGRAMLAT